MFSVLRRKLAKRPHSHRSPRRSPTRPRVEALEARWAPAVLNAFNFSTGLPDGLMATASRPSSHGKQEIEAADDFILSSETLINHATFTGLLPAGTTAADIKDVRVEIYRVFSKDSDVTRTPHVPTRVNSPSDVAFVDRDTAAHNLQFATLLLNPHFTAANSVLNGIHALPNQTTGGEGAVSGKEVRFDVTFSTPFDLPADHYFFVPQVELKKGDFFWLSTPPKQFAGDLQEWIRNDALQPDWLRVGTDIVGGAKPPVFDAAFSLSGKTVVPNFSFSTGSPDGRMATASRPAAKGKQEIESADDFILSSETIINHATFTGLLPAGFSPSDILDVRVEIYRVFPKDSNLHRIPHVPTRVNSPSDVEFADRDSAAGNLTFGFETLNAHFTAANSVLNGIHAAPHQTTGGEGAVTGEEVQFDVTFSKALDLPADHYFFVPQVRLKNGDFFWLSTPPKQFAGDLQEWIRNDALQPDWLRVGTDIVGGATPPIFDAAFSLSGHTRWRA
jgi:hypothetical protein